jgi:short subunit dehydrogenase-like uncharacterized protein
VSCPSRSFAIAGRHASKLDVVRKEILEHGDASVGLIEADTGDDESLSRLAAKTHLVINAVGPFRFHGKQVVEACVENGTSYLDICGEPEFIELIEYEYHEKAEQKGVFVASACGFDSVPVDLGNVLVCNRFPSHCCTSIETFIQLHSGPSGLVLHYPTYESAVHGLGAASELKKLRKRAAGKKTRVIQQSAFPLKMKSPGTYEPRVDAYLIPFIGADASVVKRTQYALSQGYSSRIYMCLPSTWRFYQFALYGTLFKTMANYSFGRTLLLSFPRLFCPIVSKQGPSPEQLRETTFKITFMGKGFHSEDDIASQPSKTVCLTMSGPEPGYLTCSICIVAAARMIVQGDVNLPGGGVFTPASLLSGDLAAYVSLLQERGISFDYQE